MNIAELTGIGYLLNIDNNYNVIEIQRWNVRIFTHIILDKSLAGNYYDGALFRLLSIGFIEFI